MWLGAILPALALAQTTLPAGIVGVAYAYQVSAPSGTVYSATGLPTGLAMNASSGVIAGTPTVAGSYTGTLTLSSGATTNNFSFSLRVEQPNWIVNPTGASTGGNPWSISERQFLGARITLSQPARIIAATAEFTAARESMFVSLVRLNGQTDLPTGAPFATGEEVARVAFTVPAGYTNPVVVPLAYDAAPGIYGVIFSSVHAGQTSSGSMPPYQSAAGASSFSWFVSDTTGSGWQNRTTHFKIGLATAATAGAAPAITAISAARQVVNVGQNLTLTATVTDATSYQWKRNGRAIAGATGPSYAITGAVHTRDAGWYQLVATNSAGSTTSATVFVNVAVNPGLVVDWGASIYTTLPPPTGLNNIAALAAGGAHAIALRGDGSVAAWGMNGSGQTMVPSLSNAVRIAAGANHNLAVRSDGTVIGWGANQHGEITIPTGLANVVEVAAGGFFSLALKHDGTVVAWGDNTPGVGETVVPAGLNQVVALAAGQQHTLALKSDGTVVGWGENSHGQSTPPAGLANVIAIAAGALHSVALKADGTVVAWGNNGENRATVPVGLANVVAIAAGEQHSAALKSDGTVIVWGADGNGVRTQAAALQGGLMMASNSYFGFIARAAASPPAISAISAPRQVVATGQSLTLAVTATEATSYQWKRNGRPVAGATGSSYMIPIAVSARDAGWYQVVASNAAGSTASAVVFVNVAAPNAQIRAWGSNALGQTNVPTGLTQISAIAAGDSHSVALRNDGTVVAWGEPGGGRTTVPSGLTNVVRIAAGGSHSLALKADGTVVGWGNFGSGAAAVPAGLAGVVDIAAGKSHSLALKADGSVVAWGYDAYGQSSVPAGLTGICALAGGDRHSLALKADGTVVAWGENLSGQSTVPAGLMEVIAITAGDFHSVALRADGSVVAWGRNVEQQIAVPAGLSNVVRISSRFCSNLAVRTDGSVAGWGWNTSGQIAVPTDLAGVIDAVAGAEHSLAFSELTTVPPTITIQPNAAATAAVTGNTTFRIDATGTPLPTYQWQRQPNGTTGYVNLANDSTFSGTTLKILTVTGPSLAMNGDQFRCVATNAAGTAISNAATLTVLDPPVITSAASTTFIQGVANNFTVTATGSPAPSFSVTSGTFPSWAILNASSGVISGTPPDATGSPFAFTLRAANTHQSVLQNFTLSVHSSNVPTITIQPSNHARVIGDNVTFSVTASGDPAPSYQWQRQPGGSGPFMDLTTGAPYFGATTATLSVSGVTQAMDGDQFRVVLTNAPGTTISAVARLSVLTTNVIATQPAAQHVTVGQPATFGVTPSGSGPFFYQWRRNGLLIPGATQATYTIAAAQRSDADVYDVDVTASAVRAISNPVRLIVAPTSYPGTVGIDPSFRVNLEAGGGVVNALAKLPDGKVLAGGHFLRVNGHATTNVVRLTAAGVVDPTFVAPVFNGAVRALLVQSDGKIIVGGMFSRVGAFDYLGAVRLNPDGTVDSAFRLVDDAGNPRTPNGVFALAAQADGKFLVAGFGLLSRFDANGRWDSSFTPSLYWAYPEWAALAVATDGTIWAGGVMQTSTFLARVTPQGAVTVMGTNDGPSGPVIALQPAADGKMYIGGLFTTFAGAPTGSFLRVNADGTRDPTFAPPSLLLFSQEITRALAMDASGVLHVSAGNLYIGRFNADGSALPALAGGNAAAMMSTGDGALWVGGSFTSLGGVAAEGLGRFQAGATTATPVAATLSTAGYASAVLPDAGGKLFVAGFFRTANGTPAANLARLNPNGSVDSSFQMDPSISGSVLELLRPADGKLIATGVFEISGSGRRLAVRLHPNGALDSSFTVTDQGWLAGPRASAVAREGKLLLAGTIHAGDSEWQVAQRVNIDGSHDGTFTPRFSYSGIPATGYGVVVQLDGRAVVVGEFAGRIARLSRSGELDTSFLSGSGFNAGLPNSFPPTHVLLTPTNRLLVGGYLNTYDGATVNRLVRLNAEGTLDTTFAPIATDIPESLRGMLVQEDEKVVVWGFSSATGGRLLRLQSSGQVDASFQVLGLRSDQQVSSLVMGETGQLYGVAGEVFRTAPLAAPVITTPLVAQTVPPGASVIFSAHVTAVPAPAYQWFKNGIAISGATHATLAFSNVTTADQGSYTFTATNAAGSVTGAPATLTIAAGQPFITAQPQGITVTAGQPATLAVTATAGGAALTYQWRRAGVPMADATTATLTILPARMPDAGHYDVVVTGPAGQAVSSSAYLAVAPTRYPGPMYIDPAFAPVLESIGGTVHALVPLSDGKLIIAGSFIGVNGTSSPRIARLNSDGSIDTTFNPGTGPDGLVRTVARQSDGRILIGGEFTAYDGVRRPRIARLAADGSLDATFDPGTGFNDAVYAILLATDGSIQVGGAFSVYNGMTRHKLARLTSTGTLVSSFDPGAGPSATVFALAWQTDGKLLVGGGFTSFAGANRPRIGRVNIDGSLDLTFDRGPNTEYMVQSLAVQSDGKILIGSMGFASTTARLVRVNADGSTDSSFNPGTGPSGDVNSIVVQPDGKILIGGFFSTINSQSRSRVARLNADGTVDGWVAATSDLSGVMYAVAVMPDGKIVAGGSLSNHSNSSVTGIRRFLASGTQDMFLAETRAAGSVAEVVQQRDGRLLIAGRFNYLNGTRRDNVARLLASGEVDTSFNPGTGVDRSVEGLALQPDGKLVLSGFFSSYNGTTRWKLARAHADGSLDASFNPGNGPDFGVTSLVLQPDGKMLIGGAFSSYAGVPRSHLARINASGSLDPSFDPGTGTDSWPVWLELQRDGRVLVGGWFASYNGVTRNGILRLLSHGALDPSFDPGDGIPFGFADSHTLPDDKILVGGSFGQYAGVARSNLARVHANGSLDPAFVTTDLAFVGSIGAILPQADGRILVGQATNSSSGGVTSGLARVAVTGAQDATFSVHGLKNAKTSRIIMLDDGRLLVAGTEFTDGTRRQVGLARLAHMETPAILAQPLAQSAAVGGAVTFTVSAAGGGLSYQWKFNGQDIVGATTASLQVAGLDASKAGNYSVAISNAVGAIISNAASLTVLTAPIVEAQPASRSVGTGGRTTFSVAVSGPEPLTYQWRHDGVAIPGATLAGYTIDPVSAANAGDYVVAVSNAQGTVVTLPARLTVLPNPIAFSTRQHVPADGLWAFFSTDGHSASGSPSKRLLLRLLGPTLASLGTTNALNRPEMVVYNASGSVVRAGNDWTHFNASILSSLFQRVGALPLVAGSTDAVLDCTLPPGSYAIHVRDAGRLPGTALLELYDADLNPGTIIAYLGVRGVLDDGQAAISGGITVVNSAQKSWQLRARGPSLAHGRGHPDPRLEVFEGSIPVASNDDAGGSKDASVLLQQRVGSGVYTMRASGTAGAGDVLMEFYETAKLIAPLVVTSPAHRTIALGGSTVLRADVIGSMMRAFEWRKDGQPIVAPLDGTLTITNAQPSDAGTYQLTAINNFGTALSSPVLVMVGDSATQSFNGAAYVAGTTVTITNTLSFTGQPTSLDWEVTAPDGWSYASSSGALGAVRPRVGDTGKLSWAWTSIPPSPIIFSYTLNVPHGEVGAQTIAASAGVRLPPTGDRTVIPVTPSSLTVPHRSQHSADTDQNFRLSLTELTRVIELYNTRNGTVRTGAYSVATTASEDGFGLAPERGSTADVTLTRYHSADTQGATNGTPPDGRINLAELSRVIQLYNHREGSTRTGGYRVQGGTEDGFAPGL